MKLTGYFFAGAVGLAAAIALHAYDKRQHEIPIAAAPAAVAPPLVVNEEPPPVIIVPPVTKEEPAPSPVAESPPLPVSRPIEQKPAKIVRPRQYRHPSKKKAAEPLPYSCATIRLWAPLLSDAEKEKLMADHRVTPQQRAQAARCFPKT
jgi:hypothetical protein